MPGIAPPRGVTTSPGGGFAAIPIRRCDPYDKPLIDPSWYQVGPPVPGVGPPLGIRLFGGSIYVFRSNGDFPVLWRLVDGQWREVTPIWPR